MESHIRPLPPGKVEWPASSVGALVLANLVPLVGVVFLGWDAFSVLLVFWAENVIVGVYTVLKILTAPENGLAVALFFCFQYGLYCLVHGMFVVGLFGPGIAKPAHPLPAFETLTALGLWPAVLGLFASHGVSFVRNYLLGGERQRTRVNQLQFQPYGRVFILHVTIVMGGLLMVALGSPRYDLALLVLLKIGLDLEGHLRERRKFAATPANVPDVETDGDSPA